MRTRLSYLDIIKGICIIIIIITHYNWTDIERLTGCFPFWIDMAVPVFMIISGYVDSLSYERNSINSLCDAYNLNFVGKKIIRYTIPFLVAYWIEMTCFIYEGVDFIPKGGGAQWIQSMLTGGYGPGGYYYPLMLQLIFIFPVIYFLVKENPRRGLICTVVINALYELAQRMYSFSEGTYRLLIFRYILLIAFGCYLCRGGKLRSRICLFLFFIGVVFITVVCYTSYEPYVIRYWTKTSFMAAFYIMPIFYCIVNNDWIKGIRCRFLELCGNASYNIFLVQMVYYKIHLSKFIQNHTGRWSGLLINLVICLAMGILFYYVERPITLWIIKKITPMFVKIDEIIFERG